MIQHSNEDWDEYYGMSDEDLDWYTTDHTDAEWEEKRRTELIRERHLRELERKLSYSHFLYGDIRS